MKKYAPVLLFALAAPLLWRLADLAQLREWRVEGGADAARAGAERMLERLEGENLLALDLDKVRAELENLPGVAGAKLRRLLPDGLEVRLIPRRPLAVWGGGGLVDVRGRRYNGAAEGWLPVFRGPAGRAASMADFYGSARETLSPLGAAIVQLRVGEDGEWRVFLQDGVVLYLGREKRRLRLRRYARHARRLRREFAGLRTVDLRYEKGFSVTGKRTGEDEA